MKPYKFGQRKRSEFLEHLRNGARRGRAADAVGVTRETVRLAANADPEFAAAIDQAEIDACEPVENALYETALDGNVTAMQVWLYNRAPDRWTDKRNVKVSGDPDAPAAFSFTLNIDNDSNETAGGL